MRTIRVTKKHDRAALTAQLAADDRLVQRRRGGLVALFTVEADGDATIIYLHEGASRATADAVVKSHDGKPLPPHPRQVAHDQVRELIRAVPDKATRDALRAILDLRA